MQDDSSKQQTQQNYRLNNQWTGLLLHSAFQSEEKQTNKYSVQISPYMKLTQATGPTLGGQKPKGRKNPTFPKERIQLPLKYGQRRPQTQQLKTEMKGIEILQK